MTTEIRGDEAPYRVSFQGRQEKRTKKGNSTYTNWEEYRSNTIYQYLNRLNLRLYELLNSTLELPQELQKKIKDFNNSQKKDRKKIVKGKDY